MFNKKKAKEEVEIDKKKVNDVLTLSKKILNVLYCLLYTSPSPRDTERSRLPSSA